MISNDNRIGSRTDAFNLGLVGGGPVATSLMEDQTKFNMQVPRHFAPNSILQQYMQSPNGMSAADARRMIPGGMLPTANAQSLSTYNARNPTTYGTPLKI